MKFIADLHIHSHFSRATSRTLDPEHIALWAQKKGIAVVGTGDFTHPGWLAELKDKLTDAPGQTSGPGLYRLQPQIQESVDRQTHKSCLKPVHFVLTGEISCIYKKGGITRKVHHLLMMPDMASVARFNERLEKIGNIRSDGRPILGLDSRNLLEIALEASDRAFLIPAHVWTPWFSVFGSKSGFDSMEECFEDLTCHIRAVETGLSSDPAMNRMLSALDKYQLISNSDAHSPEKLGREANIFDTGLSYDHITSAIAGGEGFLGTIEFFPEEGKYHLDGHRKCEMRLYPDDTRELNSECPKCGAGVTVGVLNRVQALADRAAPELSRPFFSLIPLREVLSELFGCGPCTKRVTIAYEKLLNDLGPELDILLHANITDVSRCGPQLLGEALKRMRERRVICQEGYDGEYGVIRLFEAGEIATLAGQKKLFEEPAQIESKKTPGRASLKKRGLDSDSPINAGLKEPYVKTDPVLGPLNLEQKAAVTHQGENLLIIAGPGTGKTKTLTHRIAYIIQTKQAEPNEILALTFTRKAAREMERRICELLSPIPPKDSNDSKDNGNQNSVTVATFHKFCLNILKYDGHRIGIASEFALCSEADAAILAQSAISETNKGIKDKGVKKISPAKFLRERARIKFEQILGHTVQDSDTRLLSAIDHYDNRLNELAMIDLDGLELNAMGLLKLYPEVAYAQALAFPWIFVDEYQDTNAAQVAILKHIVCAGNVKLCAIGDPDQAIYGFRGTGAQTCLGFMEEFSPAATILLFKNYRSSPFILAAAAGVMGKSAPLECQGQKGTRIEVACCRTEAEEAEMIVEQIERLLGGTSHFSINTGRVSYGAKTENIGFGDIAILYRLNAMGDALHTAIDRAGIPAIRSGQTPLVNKAPADILWRFFQAIQYPGNSYYQQRYKSLVEEREISPIASPEAFPIHSICSPAKLIETALEFHGIAVDSDESRCAVSRLCHLADEADSIPSLLESITLDRGVDHELLIGDRVALMSLHAAKGLEWPVVFIVGCEAQLMPCRLFSDKSEEEERRLFYVGITRARSCLILSHAQNRTLNGRVLSSDPSPFLDLVPGHCVCPLKRQWKATPKHKQLSLFDVSVG